LLGPSALTDNAQAAVAKKQLTHFAPKAKHVIYLHCVGGPPQMDMYDYKPKMGEFYDKDLPDSVRMGQRLTTMTSGQKRFEILPLEERVRARAQRFAIVNIWRSIGGKVVDTPLAVCDACSISVKDLVVADLHYRDRSGELYLVQESPRHRWAYFSEMDRNEALVFKQYDSQVNGVARFTPHSAFDLPDIPPDAPLRQSIEIRCLVTYS